MNARRPSVHAHKKAEPTPAQKQQLREAFDLFDEEQTNHVDYHSLKCVLRALGFDVKKKDVLQMMEEHDPEGRGVISYAEFLSIAAPLMCARDPEEELVKAFELIDSDGTGFISLRNLRVLVKELGEHRSEEELQVGACPRGGTLSLHPPVTPLQAECALPAARRQAMISEFDTDGDSEISLPEFGGVPRPHRLVPCVLRVACLRPFRTPTAAPLPQQSWASRSLASMARVWFSETIEPQRKRSPPRRRESKGLRRIS
jgi:centrin-3